MTFLPLLATCWLVAWIGLVMAEWASYIADGKWLHAEYSPDGIVWFSYAPHGRKSRRGLAGAFTFRGHWVKLASGSRRITDGES